MPGLSDSRAAVSGTAWRAWGLSQSAISAEELIVSVHLARKAWACRVCLLPLEGTSVHRTKDAMRVGFFKHPIPC